MKILQKIACFLFLVNSMCLPVFSQKPHIGFEHIGTSSGLSQSNIICILQDSRGFMWFGTRDGLNKYDGYKFTVYKNDAANKNSLSENTVQDIVEDSAGNLWIATWGGGLDMFDREKEKFVHHQLTINNPGVMGSKLLTCLLYDTDKNLWIGTEGQGLQMYDKKRNTFISYVHDENDPESLSDNTLNNIAQDRQGNLWVATKSGGLNLLDIKTKTFRHFKHDDNNNRSLSSNSVACLFVDSKNRLWVGTPGNGLDLFNREKEEFWHLKNNPADINSLQSDAIRSICEDDQNNLWIGTENGGLGILSIKSKKLNNYLQDDVDNSGINNNSIWSLCKDDKGNMWVGTFSAGLNFVNRDAKKFTHYLHNSSPFSLSNNNVLSILEDSKNNLWIGTDGGGMNLFDPEKGKFTTYKHLAANRKSICGNYVLKIFEDSRGDIWIGTWGDGVTVFNKEKNTFKHFRYNAANPQGIGSNNVWSIAEDADKNVWIGFYSSASGLDMYDRKNNSFVHYHEDLSDPTSLSNNAVNTIFPDRQGKLWIGTNGGGLNVFNKNTKTFTRFNAKTKTRLSDNNIYCLTQDAEGNLWIGTNRGLNSMDLKTGRIKSYYIQDGLPSNTITGILIDEKGRLWISTYNGLSSFDPVTKVFKNFSVNDGLQSAEFKMNSCYKSRSGKMYFGGINGFNEFFPDSVKEKIFDPPLVFTDFQIFNKEVLISDSTTVKSPLQKNITDTRSIELSYRESVISFEFASLNYASAEKKQYSYMLQNFDKDWNNIGTRHSATYTNLDPGKYILKVRGFNNEGNWAETMAILNITLTPPYWLTWWFRLLLLVTVSGSVVAFYKFRINTIKSQKIKLQHLVHEQTGQLLKSTQEEQKARREAERANCELEKKNKELEQFAYVASHDLQEPLRTTSSFIGLIQKQYKGQLDERADKYFNYILDASNRMKDLIKNLLDYSRIGAKTEPEQVDCNLVLANVIADLHLAVEEAQATISSVPLPVICGYPNEIKQLFQNLLINAIKFRKKDTLPAVIISVQISADEWEFTFKDNGIGIAEKNKEKIFDIFQRLHTRTEYEGSGIGLSHCKKIVELHYGKIWVESIQGNGSTFHFTISKQFRSQLCEQGKDLALI